MIVGRNNVEGEHLRRVFSGDDTFTAADRKSSARLVIDAEMHIPMDVEHMTLASSDDQPSLTPTHEKNRGTDPSTMNSNPTISGTQKDKQDKQGAEYECSGPVDNKNTVKETITEDDLDLGCLCASDEVIGIMLEKREAAMAKIEAVLRSTEEVNHWPLSKQHAMSWIGEVLDKHIAEHLGLLEADLAEDAVNNPREENAEHFDADMKVIMEYQMSQALEKTRREVQRIMMVKHIVEMLIYHEYLTSKHSLSSTFPEYLMELRWSDEPSAGLKKRLTVLFNHMVVGGDPLDEIVEYFLGDPSPENPKWRDSRDGLELPLERWGGLATLLHIHENDAIMSYFVNFIIWYSSTYVMTDDPIYHTKLLRDIKLSAQDREIIEKIWLGEKQEGTAEVAENTCLICSNFPTEILDSVPVSLPEFEGHLGLQHGSASHWIVKAVRKKPDMSLPGKMDFVMDPRERLIEVVDSDFYYLYYKYTGKLHPDEHRPSGTRMAYRGPTYKHHVLIDIQGEDWIDMMEKYGFDSARCEQDRKPYRGNEALRAMVSAKKNGEEWQNEDWFGIGTSEEPREEREQTGTEGEHASSGDSEEEHDAEEEAGGVWISNPADGA